MNPASPPSPSEAGRARAIFHLALLGGLLFVPAYALLFVWARRDDTEHGRPWRRRLRLLFAVDLMLFAILLIPNFVLAPGSGGAADASGAPAPRSSIGIHLEEAPDSDGVRVDRVLRGGPADRAGLMPQDLLVAVDGAPIETASDVRDRIGPRTDTVELQVRRRDRTRSIEVEPTRDRSAQTAVTALWKRARCDSPTVAVGTGWWVPFATLPIIVLVVAIRRQPGRSIGLVGWLVVVATAVVMLATPSTTAFVACRVAGGSSHLHGLVAAVAPFGVLAAVGAAGFGRGQEPDDDTRWESAPRLSLRSAYVLGLLYAVASVLRVGALLAIAGSLWPGLLDDLNTARELTEATAAAGGLVGVTMTVLIALLGPAAEELAFRGALLRWLGRRLSAPLAIVLCSVLFATMHVTYGIGMLTVLPLGIVFGWARWRTGGLRVPILLHMTWNALLLLRGWLLG